ncbi:biliverdin-producing heme oxygenase [Acinetobacter rathckeae]|uniref:biliverdin-producing heme oxygenase n=1 Tax=Acinetobacter rathckeae TaxID=2605272 RepID=UPI0018A2BFB2|nr:biliverdin-producing heme oxygenase [Acinetobacter rathckeae]MBF7686764.1 biliverdin-producing heme oxygenase [Acinetobacter rathckeae]
MNTCVNPTEIPSLSSRLKEETNAEHERMHQLMKEADVFSNLQQYTKFTHAQYVFQQQIEHLYTDEKVQQHVPDLDIRGRADATYQDLVDLNATPQQTLPLQEMSYLQALGWIYVSEGSTLGAAFLFKQAQKKLNLSETFGARNLAAYPEGRMVVWRRFQAALNDAQFSQVQQNEVIQGALNGFDYFGNLLIATH